jgi:hypothetical protein
MKQLELPFKWTLKWNDIPYTTTTSGNYIYFNFDTACIYNFTADEVEVEDGTT